MDVDAMTFEERGKLMKKSALLFSANNPDTISCDCPQETTTRTMATTTTISSGRMNAPKETQTTRDQQIYLCAHSEQMFHLAEAGDGKRAGEMCPGAVCPP
jgi:hypothetical protein